MFIVKIYAASVEQVLSRGFNVSEGKEDYYLAQKKKSLVLVFLLIFFYYLFVWLEQCSVSLLTFSVIHNFSSPCKLHVCKHALTYAGQAAKGCF